MCLAFWKAELLKNSWPYKIVCLLEGKIVETGIGFIMRFAFLRAELLKNHWFYKVFGSLEGRFVEKPLVL